MPIVIESSDFMIDLFVHLLQSRGVSSLVYQSQSRASHIAPRLTRVYLDAAPAYSF